CSVESTLSIDVSNKDHICFSAQIPSKKDQIFSQSFNNLMGISINLKLYREYTEITIYKQSGNVRERHIHKAFTGEKAEWREFCFSIEDFILRCDGHILSPKGMGKNSSRATEMNLRNGHFMKTCATGLPQWKINGTKVNISLPVHDNTIECSISSDKDFTPVFTIANHEIALERRGNNIYANAAKNQKEQMMKLKHGQEYKIQIQFHKHNDVYE
ncbi:unnamed protein product, partial [Meganyctiphanes norvegica]